MSQGVHQNGDLGNHDHDGGRMWEQHGNPVYYPLPTRSPQVPQRERATENYRYHLLQHRKGRHPKRLSLAADTPPSRRGHAQIKKRLGEEHRTRPRA